MRNRSHFSISIGTLILVLISNTWGANRQPVWLDVPNLPTYYYYHHGEKVDLPLDPNRLAVKFKNGTSSLTASLPGVSILKADPTGIGTWALLTLSTPVQDVAEANSKLQTLLNSSQVEFASPVFQGNNHTWVVMTPEILIRFKSEYQSQADALLPSLAPELEIVEQNFGHLSGAYKLKSPSSNGFEVLAVANSLAQDTHIEWAEPNAQFSGGAALTPNDPFFADLWGILNTGQFGGTPDRDMDGDSAWDIQTGSASIKVLILDVGVQQDHPDLNQLPGADFTGEGGGGGPVNACDKHGTAVAGCVSGIINNALGIVGIAPGCKVLSARPFVSNLSCDGSWSTNVSWTVDALDWGELQGARVSNNSNYYGFTSSAINDKYNSTYANGMVHFAAAGNFSSSTITYPASIPIVNAIAALQPNGTLASFSNHGNGLDFSGPGQTIFTTDRTGDDGYLSGDYVIIDGTSFASPYSAGVAALVLSQNPGLTPAQVEDIMHCTSQDLGATGYETTYGWGLVNAENALLNTPESDQDADGLADQCDICPSVYNPLQAHAIPGDVNASDGAPNLQDVIYLVNFVFDKGRTATGCLSTDPVTCWPMDLFCRGDANGSGGTPNLQDVIYLVNFVFDKDRPATSCLGSSPGNCWTPVPTDVCCVPVP